MPAESFDQTLVPLPSAEALVAVDIGAVTGRDETTVVLLAGPVASGKTTILVSLFELFNQGPVGGLLFAGSETLVGFERICHPGRVISNRDTPDTIRTNPSSPTAFLHIRVADTTTAPPRVASLLISDVTGEAFDEARDVAEPTIIPRQLWLRADIVCVVLDAGKMSVATKRQLVRTEARGLLRSATESKLLSPSCRLVVVTTKCDLIKSTQTDDFIGETESLLSNQFGACFASVKCHRIAARPTSSKVPYAYGVPALLTDWVAKRPCKTALAVPSHLEKSAFNAFARSFWDRHRTRLLEVFDVV